MQEIPSETNRFPARANTVLKGTYTLLWLSLDQKIWMLAPGLDITFIIYASTIDGYNNVASSIASPVPRPFSCQGFDYLQYAKIPYAIHNNPLVCILKNWKLEGLAMRL